jgi:hypothetical protein
MPGLAKISAAGTAADSLRRQAEEATAEEPDSLRRLVNDVVAETDSTRRLADAAQADSTRRLADAAPADSTRRLADTAAPADSSRRLADAAPADSTGRRRVELAQEATEREQRIVEEREQRIVELGVEAKRIIELGVEDLSSRNLLKLFEIADANIEVGYPYSKSKSVCAVFCLTQVGASSHETGVSTFCPYLIGSSYCYLIGFNLNVWLTRLSSC